jgi:hypothetical protein
VTETRTGYLEVALEAAVAGEGEGLVAEGLADPLLGLVSHVVSLRTYH